MYVLEFRVQGGEIEPYIVRFWREDVNLRSSCTCEAGNRGLACKHRIALLQGDLTALVGRSAPMLQELRCMAAGTDVEAALNVY
jgi:uncharacterized Zn finger protein